MKALSLNKQTFYYALYKDNAPVYDADGYRTGEKAVGYEDIVRMRGNISAARGTADLEQFGIEVNYNKTIVLAGTDYPIKEDTVFWIGFGEVKEFSSTSAYHKGVYIIHSGKMYYAKAEVTAGAWSAADWGEVAYNYVVSAIAKSLNSTTIAVREVHYAPSNPNTTPPTPET